MPSLRRLGTGQGARQLAISQQRSQARLGMTSRRLRCRTGQPAALCAKQVRLTVSPTGAYERGPAIRIYPFWPVAEMIFVAFGAAGQIVGRRRDLCIAAKSAYQCRSGSKLTELWLDNCTSALPPIAFFETVIRRVASCHLPPHAPAAKTPAGDLLAEWHRTSPPALKQVR
jgi:hypothetical protein